jgi:hypothetical protein
VQYLEEAVDADFRVEVGRIFDGDKRLVVVASYLVLFDGICGGE